MLDILKTVAGWSYNFRADGNLRTKEHPASGEQHEYFWDDKNQLTGVKKTLPGEGVKEIHYDYDASGRRVRRTDQQTGETREWVWDGITELITKTDGEIDGVFVNGVGGNICRIDADGNRIYYLKDILGSVIATTDQHGNLLQSYQYDEFGECLNFLHDAGDDRSYTGKRYDEDAGLYYFQARWYEGGVGRFVSRDALIGSDRKTPLSSNKYIYCLDNSLRYHDPLGLWAVMITFEGSGAIGSGAEVGGGITFDSRGNIGVVGGGGFVAQSSYSVSGFMQIAVLPGENATVKDFEGGAVTFGAALSLPFSTPSVGPLFGGGSYLSYSGKLGVYGLIGGSAGALPIEIETVLSNMGLAHTNIKSIMKKLKSLF